MKQLLDDPVAQTSSGLFVANTTHISSASSSQDALAAALRSGRKVMIAVVLTAEEARELTLKMDEAAAEAVATVYRKRG